jgi:pimeloyl-ACP methyl ester carboxylesterase
VPRLKLTLIVLGCVLVVSIVALGLWAWAPDRSREELEAKYLASPKDYRTVDGVRLHLRDTGPKDAPAIIMLHGFGSSLHTWENWAKKLSSQNRVIRFDLPGAGLSGLDPKGDYSDARTLVLLEDLMDQLGIARATLVGNSMGGRIAWKFAATRPQRVNRLILISPDGFASPGFEYGKHPEIPSSLKLMTFLLPKALLRMSLAPAYGDPERLQDRVLTRYYDLLLGPGVRDAMLARMYQSVLEDPLPLLRRIQAPTLLLWGEKDGMIPFANSADYVRAIPNSRLVSFPELGHVPHEEDSDKSLEPVLNFLNEGSSG